MIDFELTYKLYGNKALLIEWPARIDEAVLFDVMSFNQAIKTGPFPYNIKTVMAYHSLLIQFSEARSNIGGLVEILAQLYQQRKTFQPQQRKLISIPVCYDLAVAPDLHELAALKQLTVSNLVELHTATVYTVFCIGFLPGFMYLGGLNSVLRHPRKSEPRAIVEKGAVGIAGSQTGIYPQQSPGGWNIIGNTPINLFDVALPEPCLAAPGDKVEFYYVDLMEYQRLKKLVASGKYITQIKSLDD